MKSMGKFSGWHGRHRFVWHSRHKRWVVDFEFNWHRRVGPSEMSSIHTLRKIRNCALFHVVQHRLLLWVQHLLGSNVHGRFPAWNHAKRQWEHDKQTQKLDTNKCASPLTCKSHLIFYSFVSKVSIFIFLKSKFHFTKCWKQSTRWHFYQ